MFKINWVVCWKTGLGKGRGNVHQTKLEAKTLSDKLQRATYSSIVFWIEPANRILAYFYNLGRERKSKK